MSSGLAFATIRAVESVEARAEVIEFAEELHASDRKAWQKACDEADKAGKPRPQRSRMSHDLDLCRQKSRDIRVKRERNETHFNQLTNPVPTR